MDVIDEINFHIKNNGIRQAWVARKIGIHPTYLNAILCRRRELTEDVLNRLNQLWQERDAVVFKRDKK